MWPSTNPPQLLDYYKFLGEPPKCLAYGGNKAIFACKSVENPEEKVAVGIAKIGRSIDSEVEAFGTMKDIDSKHIMKTLRVDLMYPKNYDGDTLVASKEMNTVVTELIPGGELFDFVKKRLENRAEPNHAIISEDRIKRIIKSVCTSLATMHKNDVLHRDIKLDNVMYRELPNYTEFDSDGNPDEVSKDDDLVIIDFGFAVKGERSKGKLCYTNKDKILVGTSNYYAPELCNALITSTSSEIEYFETSDMWCVGIMLYILIYCKYPFDCVDEDKTNRQKYNNYHKTIGEDHNVEDFMNQLSKNLRSKSFSEECMKVLEGLLHENPMKRFTAEEVLKHSWLTGNTVGHDLADMSRTSSGVSSANLLNSTTSTPMSMSVSMSVSMQGKQGGGISSSEPIHMDSAISPTQSSEEKILVGIVNVLSPADTTSLSMIPSVEKESESESDDDDNIKDGEEAPKGLFASLSEGVQAAVTMLLPGAAGVIQSFDRLNLLPDVPTIQNRLISLAQVEGVEHWFANRFNKVDNNATSTSNLRRSLEDRTEAQSIPVLQRQHAQIVHLFEVDGGASFDDFCTVMTKVKLDCFATQEMFNVFDADKSGRIDQKELIAVMKLMVARGIDTQASRTELYFKIFDRNGDGKISHDELSEVVDSLTRGDLSGTDYSGLFRTIDKDGDGFVDKQEFEEWFEKNQNSNLLAPIATGVSHLADAHSVSASE